MVKRIVKIKKYIINVIVCGGFFVSTANFAGEQVDPTRPVNSNFTARQYSGLEIQAIFASDVNASKVMVGGVVLKEGDRVANLTVVTIDVDKVVLKDDRGQEMAVYVNNSQVKTEVTDK